MTSNAKTVFAIAVLAASSTGILAQQRGTAQAQRGGTTQGQRGASSSLPAGASSALDRGTISGNVVQVGVGLPVKRASISLRRINQENRGNANGAAGAAGTTQSLDNLGTLTPNTLPTGRGGGGATTGTTATGGTRGATAGGQNRGATANAGAAASDNNRGGGGRGGGGATRTAQADNNGQFTLTNIEPGIYRVSASAEGFLNQEFGQQVFDGPGAPVTVIAGGVVTVDFQLVPGGVVTGTVMDQDGFPLNGAQVQVYTYDYRNGQRVLALVSGKTAQTNDIGEYRVPYLNPGEYFVVARPTAAQAAVGPATAEPVSVTPNNRGGQGGTNGRGGRGNNNTRGNNTQTNNTQPEVAPPAMAYVPSFYPGSIDPSQAAAIQVPGGSDVRGIDIVLRPVTTITVSGRVNAPAVISRPEPQQTGQQQNNQRGGGRGGAGTTTNGQLPQQGGGRGQTRGGAGAGAGAAGGATGGIGVPGTGATTTQNGGRGQGQNTGRGGQQNAGRGQQQNGANPAATARGGNNGGNNGNGATNTAVSAQIILLPIGLGTNTGGGGGRGGGAAGGGGRGAGAGGGGGRGGGGGGGGRGNDFAAPSQGPRGGRGANPGAGGAAGAGGRGGTTGGNNGRGISPVGGAGQEARATVNRDGTFQIKDVIPGSYLLFASGRVSNVDVSANMRLDVGGGNIENLALDLRQGVDIPGQIYTETQAPERFRTESMQINLTPADSLPAPVRDVRATSVTAAGSFVLRDVAAARYRLRVPSQSGAYVIDAKYGGFSVLTEAVQIDTAGIPLQILIGFSPGRVETVVESVGKPFVGATVVLIPNTRGRTDLYTRATSGADGKVTFANVPPGDYKVFAWETVKQDAWQSANFMDQFEDRGHSVHVEKGGLASDTHLQVIRAAQ